MKPILFMKYSQFIFLLFFILLSIKADAIEDVNSVALSELSVSQKYQFPASVIALKNVTVSSEMAGIILSKTLLIGSKILKSNTIVKMDCTDNQLAKEQGTAALKSLQIQKQLDEHQLKRAQQLVRVKSVSKQELDQRQTALDADIASIEQQHIALKIIDRNISKCHVKAPFSGIIIDYPAKKSSYVTPGAALFSLIDPKAVEVEASLPLALSVHLNKVNHIVFNQNQINYPLIIRAALPNIDSQTKQQNIRLAFKQKSVPLPNSIGHIEWNSQQRYIPSQYLVTREGQLGIFIEQDGKAIFHHLKDAIEGQNSPINLSSNTLVITNKLLILNNNDKIN